MKIKSCGKLSGKCLPDAIVQWWVSCDWLPQYKMVASRPRSSLWGYWCVHATTLKEKRKNHFWNSCELTNHRHLGSKLYSSQSSDTFPLQFQPPVKVKYINHILYNENLYMLKYITSHRLLYSIGLKPYWGLQITNYPLGKKNNQWQLGYWLQIINMKLPI